MVSNFFKHFERTLTRGQKSMHIYYSTVTAITKRLLAFKLVT